MTTPFTTASLAQFFEGHLECLKRGEKCLKDNMNTVRHMNKTHDLLKGLVDTGRGSVKNKTAEKSYSVEVIMLNFVL